MSKMKEQFEERKLIVDIINDILETTWSEFDSKHGKQIDVPPKWRRDMKYLISKYKDVGWAVEYRVTISSDSPSVRREYLVFQNPSFIRLPQEIRKISTSK